MRNATKEILRVCETRVIQKVAEVKQRLSDEVVSQAEQVVTRETNKKLQQHQTAYHSDTGAENTDVIMKLDDLKQYLWEDPDFETNVLKVAWNCGIQAVKKETQAVEAKTAKRASSAARRTNSVDPAASRTYSLAPAKRRA